MILNKPYIYLKEDEPNKVYFLHVLIMLEDYRVEKHKIMSPNDALDAHENEKRMRSGHPYQRNMRRSHIRIDLDKLRGHQELWSYTYKFSYNDINRSKGTKSELVQVIVLKNDGKHTHEGTSVGHYGDAD